MSEFNKHYAGQIRKLRDENLLIKEILSELFKAEEDYDGAGFYSDSDWKKRYAMLSILVKYKCKDHMETIWNCEFYRQLTEEETQELNNCVSVEKFASIFQLKLRQEIIVFTKLSNNQR